MELSPREERVVRSERERQDHEKGDDDATGERRKVAAHDGQLCLQPFHVHELPEACNPERERRDQVLHESAALQRQHHGHGDGEREHDGKAHPV